MGKEKSNQVNIYRISKDYKFNELDFNKVKDFEKEFEDENQKLFIRRMKPAIPNWLNYIEPLVTSNLEKIKNYNSSFILLINHKQNIYALAGGYCYSLMEKYIDKDFGIKIALRMINENHIKAINQRSLKGTTRQIFRAVTGYDPAFDRENVNRILNSIIGKGEFEGKSFQISGKSALSLRTIKDIKKINEVLNEIEIIEKKPENIQFPKSYEIENNEMIIQELNEEMLKIINDYWKGNSNRENLFLELKDPLSQIRCINFKAQYKNKIIEFEDFDLDIIKEQFVKDNLIDIPSLIDVKKIILSGYNEDSFEEFKNNFLELLVCEILKNGNYYIKIENNWLRILDEFQKIVDEQILNLDIYDKLPVWDKAINKGEDDYNKFVANEKGWKCLHGPKNLITIKGYSNIELCDIFDQREKIFFHIKKIWGSKSAYLFTQGTTSADLFYNSSEFRQICKDKWPDEFGNDLKVNKIVFGIASDKITNNFPKDMTFFAKLSLYNTINNLKQSEYQTLLAPIKIVNKK